MDLDVWCSLLNNTTVTFGKESHKGISTQGNNAYVPKTYFCHASGMLPCMNHEVNLLGATADDNFGLKKLSIVYLRKSKIYQNALLPW